MSNTKKPNRLISSGSPYLQQHAYNPVDWHEWTNEALSRAKDENKPILVSIGYSSCHWCHVMEREVFEKDDIAGIMNQSLVCIKVDREERPDIDTIYMEAVQAMGIHGGWPLNVFLTPDQKPFYGGTYFPPDQWLNVIRGVSKAFNERQQEVQQTADELANALAKQDTSHLKKIHEFSGLKEDLTNMYAKLSSAFDKKWGGLEKAPKFVMPSVWLWLLRYHYIEKNQDALDQLNLTLTKIGRGGIYDQIGGGFARYSVDGYWFAPHFEKMLYDNAQLLSLYSEAYAVTKNELYKNIVYETFHWLQGEMMHPQGAFYSALDADSEGVEGKFYVWTRKEIQDILGGDADLFCEYYNVKPEGNWEHGNNILIRTQPDGTIEKKFEIDSRTLQAKLGIMKEKMLAERDKRIRPGLDDKIITSWNAMTVVGLTDAYRYFGEKRFLDAAVKCMTFLENELMSGNEIFRSFKGKRSKVSGFLDDYAYVIQACIKLYQVTFNDHWIKLAGKLIAFVIENFYDTKDGFFFYTSDTSEALIARRKEIFDNVIPSSNSVMAQNLFQLGSLMEKDEWMKMAEAMTTPLAHLIVQEPNYMSNWGIAYCEIKHQLAEVVIAEVDGSDIALRFLQSYQPFALMMKSEAEVLPLTQNKRVIENRPTIYVCFDKTCQKPVHEVEEAFQQIAKMN